MQRKYRVLLALTIFVVGASCIYQINMTGDGIYSVIFFALLVFYYAVVFFMRKKNKPRAVR
jgi:hypothetical protein